MSPYPLYKGNYRRRGALQSAISIRGGIGQGPRPHPVISQRRAISLTIVRKRHIAAITASSSPVIEKKQAMASRVDAEPHLPGGEDPKARMYGDLNVWYKSGEITQADWFGLQRSIANQWRRGEPCVYQEDWPRLLGFKLPAAQDAETEANDWLAESLELKQSNHATSRRSGWRTRFSSLCGSMGGGLSCFRVDQEIVDVARGVQRDNIAADGLALLRFVAQDIVTLRAVPYWLKKVILLLARRQLDLEYMKRQG